MKRCFIFILAAALCLIDSGKKGDDSPALVISVVTNFELTALGSPM